MGTRESKLALVQTNLVINEIKKKHHDLEFEIVGIKTKGDALLNVRLDKVGGKGLFIKELEQALTSGAIDMAVHSLKDMPAELPEGLTITAVSKREDPRDVLVTPGGMKLDDLKKGAVVGTSSLRREVQLSGIRPDLQFKTLRGNVLTRLNKLLNGEYAALVLAAAGLKRLGLEDRCDQYFTIEEMIPAVGQGVMAVETRKDDDTSYLKDSIHCPETAFAVCAERTFMVKLNGSCSTPIGAHAVIDGDNMKIWGMLALEDGTKVCRSYVEGSKYDAVSLGSKLAHNIMENMKSSSL